MFRYSDPKSPFVGICDYCKEDKIDTEEFCPGCDECIYGVDGGPAKPCLGWGSYCCRCGADYARSQMP